MPQKYFIQKSLSDQFIPAHKLNKGILHQINQNIDWSPISFFLNKKYYRGKSELGRQAYQPLLLFKMILLQTWYNLSDQEVENQLNDRFSFIQFCGLGMHDKSPDSSSIERFRGFLVKANLLERLLKKFNKQLEKKQLKRQEWRATMRQNELEREHRLENIWREREEDKARMELYAKKLEEEHMRRMADFEEKLRYKPPEATIKAAMHIGELARLDEEKALREQRAAEARFSKEEEEKILFV